MEIRWETAVEVLPDGSASRRSGFHDNHPVRRSDLRRIPLAAALAAASACAPRTPERGAEKPTPTTGVSWPVVRNETGVLEERDGATVYRDGEAGFTLTLPPGVSGRLSFVADPSGPPPAGRVRLRAQDGGSPPCVIDVAVLPLETAAGIPSSIAHGREVFFVAERGRLAPPFALPVREVWAATLVPVDPSRIDLGYWLVGDERTLRVEGRIPVERMGACKEVLDALARSLSPG